MTRAVHLHPEAAAELEETVVWYEQRHPGLGRRLLSAVDAAIEGIQLWPESAPAWSVSGSSGAIRRSAVRGFPYRIIYTVGEETIEVLALAHDKRKPGYWRDREPMI
ncbi:MAG TPA: type II toxin-antitoxin system RelE/ParE family toxin [Marmoricola sp.]|nr:type II toxin-antitoxin system RelE/ParE family toxin [Marmoricola sp.]